MLSLKAPIYKTYFYFLILFAAGTSLASTGIIGKLDLKIFGATNRMENGSKEKKMSFFRPGNDPNKNIKYSQTCFQQNDSTQFFGVTNELGDRYSWDFGVAGVNYDTSSQRNPYWHYSEPGTYTVSLTIYRGAAVYTWTEEVTIAPGIATPNLGEDTTICPNQFPWQLDPYPGNNGPSGAKYIWSNGDTTKTTKADSAGNFWVAVTVNGCTKVDEVEVTEYGAARKRAAIWYFGNNAGMDFNKIIPTPLNNAPLLSAPEGVSAISDIDGKLIFYTDGKTIYNKDHQIMENGENIGGSPTSTQSSIIIPWPNRMPYYFVFTTEAVTSPQKKLMVSLVDMKGDSASGAVLFKNNIVDINIAEKLTAYALKDADDKDSIYWLITQEVPSGRFKVFQIDETGIRQPPQTFNFGQSVGAAEAQGTMKISSTGKYLSVAAGDRLELYSFNDTTGVISDSVVIKFDGGGPAYGVEFSPDGSKVYVSRNDGIYQYDIADSLGNRLPNDSIRSKRNIYQLKPPGAYGALQLAPDGRIYVAVNDGSSLKAIPNPNGNDSLAGQLVDVPLLSTGKSKLGLPNFVQSFLEEPRGPGLGYQDACGPGPINFFASGWGDRDVFTWTIDGAVKGSGLMMTQITENMTLGRHTVVVRITNDCAMDTTMTLPFTIIGGPNPVVLPNDFTLCPGDTEELDAGRINVASEKYLWSTGDTTRRITITQPGVYTAFVIKNNGCVESDQVVVSPPRFGEIVGDTTLCEGQISRLTTSSPALGHVWKRNGIQISTANYIDITLGGDYSVTVTDPAGCSDEDVVTVTSSRRPLVIPQITGNPLCGERSGSIVLARSTENQYDRYSYQWFNQNDIIRGATSNTLAQVVPGIYRVVVTHPGGCDSVYTVSLNPSNVPVNVSAGLYNCANRGAPVNVSITGGTAPYALTIYKDGDFVDFYTFKEPQPSPNWTIDPIDEGFYTMVITDNLGCSYSNSVTVMPSVNKPVQTDLGPPRYTCSATLPINFTVNPAYTYTWNAYVGGNEIAGAISSQPTIGSIVAQNPFPGSQSTIVDYVLTVANGSCIKTDTAQVNFSSLAVTLPNNTDICDNQGSYIIVPSFTPPPAAGETYSYRWDRVSTPVAQLPTKASSLSVSESGTYRLTVTSYRTGCSVPSNTQTVKINPAPEDKLGPDRIDEDCEGATIELDAGYSNGIITWSGPDGPMEETTRKIKVTKSGQYVATINLNNCEASFDKFIKFKEAPDSQIEVDKYMFCSERQKSVTIAAATSTEAIKYRYRWTDEEGNELGTSFRVAVNKGGNYFVEIKDANLGCITNASVHVKDECETKLFAPNAFSPNGNGKNDKFIFLGEPVSYYNLSIYNRWGQLIYHAEGPEQKEEGWDGKTNEKKEAPPGTYIYSLVYSSQTGDQKLRMTKKGSVVLIR